MKRRVQACWAVLEEVEEEGVVGARDKRGAYKQNLVDVFCMMNLSKKARILHAKEGKLDCLDTVFPHRFSKLCLELNAC